jgi:hypothetical protein
MDPAVGGLLKVQVDDAIAPGKNCTSPMGNNVEPLRASN